MDNCSGSDALERLLPSVLGRRSAGTSPNPGTRYIDDSENALEADGQARSQDVHDLQRLANEPVFFANVELLDMTDVEEQRGSLLTRDDSLSMVRRILHIEPST